MNLPMSRLHPVPGWRALLLQWGRGANQAAESAGEGGFNWLLAAFALFIALSSVPFWKGLFQMAMGTGQ